MKALDRIAELFGASTRESFERLGAISAMLLDVFRAKFRFRVVMDQMVLVGISSLPIVMLAAVFTGFIATEQVRYLSGDLVGLEYLGMLVLRVTLSELGPTLIGLVLAGRISAKLAAEIGTMRVNEQIDAMICLSLDPISYIVAPRVITGFVMVPVLFIFGSIAAIVSAQMLATVAYGLHPYTFYNSTRFLFDIKNIYMGIIKSCIFGGLITLSGCYYGYYTTGGAVGVGASTRRAVVAASILILITNLIISQLMM